MKFRKTTAPTNDGLPIVHGKKVSRRKRFGLNNARSSPNNDGGSGASSFLKKCLWWVVIISALSLALIVHYLVRNNQPSTATAAVSTASVQTTTKAEAPISSPVQTKKDEAPIPSPVQTTTKAEAPISSSKGGYGYPDKCTTEQLAHVEKQLPNDPLGDRPWRDASFSKATVKSAYAQNPILMREFYASDNFKLGKNHQFFGVVLGWRNNDVPIDTLAIGSRDANIDTKKWVDKLKLDSKMALSPVAINSAAGIRPARVLVVDWNKPSIPFEGLRDSLGYSDDKLQVVSIPNPTSDLLNVVRSKMPGGVVATDQPIHFLNIHGAEGMDPSILKALTSILKQVRYVHFEYNKAETWQFTKLSAVINSLKNEGLVCYFAGSKEADYGFWRITDCFLKHYDNRHWAGISCVNVKHDDVKELADGIEKKFLETLKKDHTFPVSQSGH
jgi:hypothetical protein